MFHKAELVEAGAIQLSETVRSAIGDARHQSVVGVVINAVDDHLAKSDQLRLAWTVGQMQHLDALLNEAQLAGRWVVLTSDHGHVLDESTRALPDGQGERWRHPDGDPAPEEIAVQGTRIQQTTGQPGVIVPWSETVRYTKTQKRGYHGGVTPQEVLVPIGVLTRDRLAEGWEWQLPAQPAWWEGHVDAPVKRPRASAPRQGHLFDLAPRRDVPATQSDAAHWIEQVLQSPVFAAQQRLAGRNVPGHSDITAFLTALDDHQYRLSRAQLSQALRHPEPRLPGLLAKLKTVFNVEGYPILIEDEATGAITLNRQLLDKQFQLQMR